MVRYDNFELQRYLRDAPGLTLSERCIALVLSTYRNGDTGACFPSQIRLAKRLGVSRQHLNEVVKSLKVKKILKVERTRMHNVRKKTISNYVFLFDKG